MNLRERLGGFIGWPLSRKLFLLGFVGVFATLLAVVVNAITFSTVRTSTMDLRLLNHYFMYWIPGQALVTAAAWPAARAGREGRWAARLFIMVQSPFIAGLLHLFGTMSTPLVAIYPAIVILWTLVLDEGLGLFGFVNLAGWISVVGMLEARGRLPYAPVMLDRTFEDQSNPVWFWAVFFHIFVLLSFCMSLCVLFQRTRHRQDARLQLAHAALERANRLIRRYVPAGLAEQIDAGRYHDSARPERRKLSMVFTGIENFTAAAERLEAEDLAAVLAEYLSQMVAIADRHDGTVNHVAGDRMLILFGVPQANNAPGDEREHALKAVRMAQEMQRHAAGFSDMWSRHGLAQPFRIRIGVNTGYASVGDFGSDGRKLYTGIGLQINLAERIQAECPPGQVLLSHSTRMLLRAECLCNATAEIEVEGLAGPLRVYTLAAADEPAVEPTVAPDAPARGDGRVWTFANARFDEGSLELFLGGELVELERKPLEVLRYLLHRPGEVVSKDELLAALWPGRILSDTVIAKCVSRIREVLCDEEQGIIKTVHGFGYRFSAEIKGVPSAAPSNAISAAAR
jgi:class 3 adenylate cyclase/DNA-binding winged helix-turn-helix (wHTH) protein